MLHGVSVGVLIAISKTPKSRDNLIRAPAPVKLPCHPPFRIESIRQPSRDDAISLCRLMTHICFRHMQSHHPSRCNGL